MGIEEWEQIEGEKLSGGQGTIIPVRNRLTGKIGARKVLKEVKSSEQRYRFLKEVGALRVMSGNGVPLVLDANELAWESKDIELYLVMEFIAGSTLQALVQRNPPDLEQALSTIIRVLRILEFGHALPLLHRDLKPDNVIIRRENWSDPVLVDFGIASYADDGQVDFRTPAGKELGNRFLRLPEFAPGGNHYDQRSDVAMAAGLLFFMLSGKAPRTLVNEEGLYPYELAPSPVRAAVLEDKRWYRLQQLLHIAFQYNIAQRFQSAEEFRSELMKLEMGTVTVTDDLEQQIRRLEELNNSATARERSEAAPAMEAASRSLYEEVKKILSDIGLQQGGQHPVFKSGGAKIEFYCVVSKQGQTDPSVIFRHKIELAGGRFRAISQISDRTEVLDFEGSSADREGLRVALTSSVRRLVASIVKELNGKLEPPASLLQFFQSSG